MASRSKKGKSATHRFAELAGNAALLARGVSSKGVFAAESGGDGALDARLIANLRGPRPADGPRVPMGLYLFKRVEDGVPATIAVSPAVPVVAAGRGTEKGTHGGRKNCSSSTYIPLAISVKRKNLPIRSRVLSLSHGHSTRLLVRKLAGGGPLGVA